MFHVLGLCVVIIYTAMVKSVNHFQGLKNDWINMLVGLAVIAVLLVVHLLCYNGASNGRNAKMIPFLFVKSFEIVVLVAWGFLIDGTSIPVFRTPDIDCFILATGLVFDGYCLVIVSMLGYKIEKREAILRMNSTYTGTHFPSWPILMQLNNYELCRQV